MAYAEGTTSIVSLYQDLPLIDVISTRSRSNSNLSQSSQNNDQFTINPTEQLSPRPPPATPTINTKGLEKPTRRRNSSVSISGFHPANMQHSVSSPASTTSYASPQQYQTNFSKLPNDRDILGMVHSPNGAWFFLTWSNASVELWISQTCTLIGQLSRTIESVSKDGSNQLVIWSDDCCQFVIQTSKGYLNHYSIFGIQELIPLALNDPKNGPQAPQPLTNIGIDNTTSWLRNPGKLLSIKFLEQVKVEDGVLCTVATENSILISTHKNSSLISYSWKDKILLNTTPIDQVKFMEPPNPLILKMEFDPLQHLLLLLTSDGQVYLTRRKLVLNEFESSESPYKIQGVKVHTSDGSKTTFASNIALNTKFFLIAISTKGDQVIIYSYSKSASQPQQLFTITIGGLVTSLAWSNDGECLAVGSSTKGVSLFDICGNLTLNTAQINYILSESTETLGDSHITSVRFLSFLPDSNKLMIVPYSEGQSGKFTILPLTKPAFVTIQTTDNLSNPALFNGNSVTLELYKQLSNGSINPDYLPHTTQIPLEYLLEHAPIQYVSLSERGTYLAVSGQRGLIHYSLITKKWKMFNNRLQERKMQVCGGIAWYRQALIVTCQVIGTECYQLRIYPRDQNLEDGKIIYLFEFKSKPIYLNRNWNYLVVFTQDNIVNFFELIQNSSGFVTTAELVQRISLSKIVKVPQTVRHISWFQQDLKHNFPTLFILCSDILQIFTPETIKSSQSSSLQYKMFQIAQHIDNFNILDKYIAGVRFLIWGYHRGHIRIWISLNSNNASSSTEDDEEEGVTRQTLDFHESITVDVPFRPLNFELEKGFVLGIETNFQESKQVPGVSFTHSSRSYLIFHKIIYSLIKKGHYDFAYFIARHYERFDYFSHGLEILLHDCLEDVDPDNSDTLKQVVNLIQQFPSSLEIIVGCARKIEIALWQKLFEIAGSPYDLFNSCLEKDKLGTATSYLIILHTLENDKISKISTIKLFNRVVELRDLELFKDLVRFLKRITGFSIDKIKEIYINPSKSEGFESPTIEDKNLIKPKFNLSNGESVTNGVPVSPDTKHPNNFLVLNGMSKETDLKVLDSPITIQKQLPDSINESDNKVFDSPLSSQKQLPDCIPEEDCSYYEGEENLKPPPPIIIKPDSPERKRISSSASSVESNYSN